MVNLLIFIIAFYLNICKVNILKKNNNTNFNTTIEYKGKKNLIVGTIQNYPLKVILPFFKSLKNSDFTNYDIVIFTRNVSPELINYLISIKVIVYQISENYKHFPAFTIRWKLYIDFLNKNKNKYKLVLHADVRDTIFQKDIFKFYENYGPFFGIAIEDGLLSQEVNKQWVIGYCGEEKYNKIKNERIICFGTLWGTLDKFLEFSNIFWQKLIQKPYVIDQAIGNYLIYYEKVLKDYIIKSDNFGPVMTLALSKRCNILVDKDNRILNFGGQIASIIHQYDRKLDIKMSIINRYCPEKLNLNISGINQKNNFYFIIIHFMLYFEIFTITLLIKIIYKYLLIKNYK